ncbi:hypothetical protein TMatcc_003582 [Talaromyces marneffei ATCC 18224]
MLTICTISQSPLVTSTLAKLRDPGLQERLSSSYKSIHASHSSGFNLTKISSQTRSQPTQN